MITKYPLLLRILHWLMALALIAMLIIGLYMEGLPREDSLRPFLYNMHKATGFTLLGCVLLRFVLRLTLGVPKEPDAIPHIEKILARCAHWGAYSLMAAIPLSGIIMTNAFGFTVHWFGGFALPKIVSINKELGGAAREAHELMAYALIAFIGLHVAGVIKHYLREKINLLNRMI